MGLQRKRVTVRTKHGKVYQRSMLVRGTDAVKRVLRNHGGKLLAGAAIASGAALAYHKREAIKPHLTRQALSDHAGAAAKGFHKWRMTEGANMAKRVVEGVGTALATHYIAKAVGNAGQRVGRSVGRAAYGGKRGARKGAEFGKVFGEALGEATLGHAVQGHIGRAATETGKALRRKNIIRAKRK